jgi:hypothetical protein
MSTLQDVVNIARYELNDPLTTITAAGTSTNIPRQTDAQLLQFANDGIAKALVIRPDLYYGSWSTPYTDLQLTDIFPLPIEYRYAIASYMIARNQSADDEFVIEQRADKSMADFMKGLGVG